MARYDYRCGRCGIFEVTQPLGSAPPRHPCPTCADSSTRIFSAPALLSGQTLITRAVEADRKSQHEPAVVSAPPPRITTAGRHRPLQARLPHP